jgi:hypothetical protein
MNIVDAPVLFEVCPVCGHKGTVVQERVEELIVEGKLPAGVKFATFSTITKLANPNRTLMLTGGTVPAVIAVYDICSNPKCGIMRCVMVQEGKVAAEEAKQYPQPKPGAQPPFPFAQ